MTQSKQSNPCANEKLGKRKVIDSVANLRSSVAQLTPLPTFSDRLPSHPLAPPSEGSLFDLSAHGSSSQLAENHLHSDHMRTMVHRCRFVDYTPGSITALACTPSTWDPPSHFGFPDVGEKSRGVLAVGRGNGDVEIWVWLLDNAGSEIGRNRSASTQGWVLYRTLPGHIPSTSTANTRSPSGSSSSASKIEHLVFSHQIIPVDPMDEEDVQSAETHELVRALPRLFGSNGGEEVLEWEWDGSQAGVIKRTLPMPPSIAIWSLAVCPHSKTLAIGCDDGTIRLASIADDQLELTRRFDPCKSRLLSLAWGSIDTRSKSEPAGRVNQPKASVSNTFLVSGCADSGLRKWDMNTGRCVGRMTVDKLQGEPTLVWSVAVVAQFIVSGDSMGNINFWDSMSCSRLQTIRAHRADILCLVISPDGNDIFTSGVDQKTCQLTLTNKGVERQPDLSKWIVSATRRLHSHDVRALTMSPPYNPYLNSLTSSPEQAPSSSQVPVLVSGGLDMYLVLCPAASPSTNFRHSNLRSASKVPSNPISDSSSILFEDSIQRKISYVTRRTPVVQLSTRGRLLVCRKDRSIGIWRLGSGLIRSSSSPMNSVPETEKEQEAWRKVVDMELKLQTNLVTSAISSDGRWLAVSDLYEVKLFSLNWDGNGDLTPRRVRSFTLHRIAPQQAQGAWVILFSPDSTRLILATTFTSQIIVVGLDQDHRKEFPILQVFHQHRSRLVSHHADRRVVISPPNTSLPSPIPEESHDESNTHDDPRINSGNTIMGMTISSDCQWLATVDSTQVLHIFNLDLLKHHCVLPASSLFVNCLAFSPTTPSTLVIGFANNSIQVMNVETRKVPEWAHRVCANAPIPLSQLRDPMIGISFEPSVEREDRLTLGSNLSISSESKTQPPHILLLWGATWTCKLTLPDGFSSGGVGSRRSKRPRQLGDLLSIERDESEVRRGSTTPTEITSVRSSERSNVKFEVQVSHKYQPILLLDFFSPQEMVIVERPFFGLLAHLPPAWVRTGVYGT